MERLDIYEDLPQSMRKYLSTNGWHFSKELFEYAVKRMKDRNGNKITPTDKAKVDEVLKANGINLKNDILYDATYVYNMAMADYYGGALKDTTAVAHFVRDYLDDYDGTPTRTLDEYMGRSIGMGRPIPFDEVL